MKKHKTFFFFADDTMIYVKNPKKSTKYPRTSKQVQQNHRTNLQVQKNQLYFYTLAMNMSKNKI